VSGRARVLVVDDERDMAESCAFFLARAGHESVLAASGEEALARLREGRFDLVVTDLRMPRMSGLTLLERIRRSDPDVEVLLITGYPEIETAVAAIKAGAFDYVTKPFAAEAFLERVEKALAHHRMREGNADLRERLRKGTRGRELVHRSAAFAEMVATLERAARSEASVLLLGESGTGKELLAHHLHDASPRASRPFVPVDCATIPENLVESELFGHVKGAFSGADQSRPGLFEVADAGTLFLDEVGELPLSFQPKLLRTLQERQLRRVGATEWKSVDVRIVSATNRDLSALVAAGDFREDLFYRLDVVRIRVPPLRERREDVEPLALHFLESLRAKTPHPMRGLAPAAREALLAYDWPGNVRQLRNAIERAVALGHGPLLEPGDLPAEVLDAARPPLPANAGGTFQEMKQREIAALERSYLEGLLRKHGGNVTHCAEEAGMARSAFQKVMQRYGMKSSDYRK
jgi:DNA-binding NtrC family response regulator